MARLYPEMGLIDHETGGVNAIFGGDRGGLWGGGGVFMERAILSAMIG